MTSAHFAESFFIRASNAAGDSTNASDPGATTFVLMSGHDPRQFAGHPLDDPTGRAGRRENAHPGADIEVGHATFLECRHERQRRSAPLAGDHDAVA